MRARDIVIGKTYKHKLYSGYLHIIEVLYPKQKENNTNCIAVKCIHSQMLNDKHGQIMYCRPCNIIKFEIKLNKDLQN